MIELVPESEGKLLGMKVRGGLTERDYSTALIPHLDWVIQGHGRARLLFFFEEGVETPEPDSPWEAARFGLRHKDQIEKLAVVGDDRWVTWAQAACAQLASCEVGSFPKGREEKAWDWIML